MASDAPPQSAANDGPCMICCATRSTTVGLLTGGVLGFILGGAADLALTKTRPVRWG